MSQWGTKIDIPIFDNKINFKEPENIGQYEYNCNNNKCLNYMYNNGKTIYDETDKFINTSDNVYSDKIKMLFNTENSIKNQLLNDEVINDIKRQVIGQSDNKKYVDNNYIINHMLYILKPYLLNDTNIDFNIIKQDIINTIIFKLNYMENITTQLKFLFDDNTVQYINNMVYKDIKINPKKEFILKILKNEINKFTNRYNTSNNKITTDNIQDVYYNKISTLTEKNMFTIIYNTIAHIFSILKIEQNVKNNNEKLDKWDTILGDNNKHGLRGHSQIRLNENKPPGMLFNMTY
jgi:hypothetical protein